MDLKEKEVVLKEVEKLRDDIINNLQRLVCIPSVTGNEGPAQEYMRQLYEDTGLEVHTLIADRSKVENHPAFCDSGKPFEGRPNIIGIQKGNSGKNSIILNGHVDVVSPEPIDQWQHDPWSGEIAENRLYGRGACDMKSGLIANLFAVKAMINSGIDPEGTVMLQSVIEEEDGGGGGALACLVEGFTADGMIVSEPAPPLNIALAGLLRFLVKVYGKSAHPAQSQLGVNAIGKMLKIYEAITQLDEHRKTTVRYPLFEETGNPAAHLIAGTFTAGDHISTVAGFAEMGCRIGFVPGEKKEEIRKLVENTVKEISAKDAWLRDHPPDIEWLPFVCDPYYQDPSHPFVASIISSLKKTEGQTREVKLRGGTWSEDTRLAQYFDIPAVSFGASGERHHGPDEYVDLDSLILATKSIALASLDWCSQDKEPK